MADDDLAQAHKRDIETLRQESLEKFEALQGQLDKAVAGLKKEASELGEERAEAEVERERKVERLERKVERLEHKVERLKGCLLYTSPSPRDGLLSRMPSSA